MIHKRQGFKVVLLEPAKTRIRNGQCAGCGKPKSQWKRSKRWLCCSVKCTAEMRKMYYSFGWGEFRTKVFRRDNYACNRCGFQSLEEQNVSEWLSVAKGDVTAASRMFKENADWYGKERIKLRTDTSLVLFDDSKLIADHIRPIALGGAEWEMNNIQTLCVPCNKHKTKQDSRDIALQRRRDKFYGD